MSIKTFALILCILAVLGLMSVFQGRAQAQYGGFCGDSSCDSGLGETCSTCASDCGACPTNTPTPTPTFTPTPTPTSFTISGTVYVDTNTNGVKDGSESGYNGATVTITGVGSQNTNASGNYSFTNLSANTYTVTLTVPPSYIATTSNPVSRSVGPDATANFGIISNPACSDGLDNNGNGKIDCLDPGCHTNGIVESCPPPVNTCGDGVCNSDETNTTCPADCPGGGSCGNSICNIDETNATCPADCPSVGPCGNGICNIGESNATCSQDCTPPGGSTGNDTHDPIDNSENPQCSDGFDNNSNGKIDAADQFCHTDGNPGNPGSYDPNDPSEYDTPPVCSGGLTATPPTVGSGETSTVAAENCSSYEPPTYNWPPPTIITGPGGSGGNPGTTDNSNPNNPSTTYTAPGGVCDATVIGQDVQVTNSSGTNTYSTNINLTPKNTVSGVVLQDSAGNNCASGTTPYTGGAVVTLYDGSNPTDNDTTDPTNGTYSVTDTNTCGDRTAVISSIGGYSLRRVRVDGGSWTNSGLSGFVYGPFDLSANHTLDFCISNVAPWFQTTTGDVRIPTLTNHVPSGQFASPDVSNPSVFFSSGFASNFGDGSVSAKGWKVDDEYSVNGNSKNRNGTASYSFYASRIAQENVTTTDLCSVATCNGVNVDISNLPTGVYTHTGDLTITSYSHAAGSHILLLLDGSIAIASDIRVPAGAGNLLIMASKGNITIEPSVGVSSSSDTTTNIEGIFTAEGSITLSGSSCADGSTPDKRLNVAGALIANSIKPFTIGGSGSLLNNRSLCLSDQTDPVLYIAQRLDFVTQLTDFYKTSFTLWREIAP